MPATPPSVEKLQQALDRFNRDFPRPGLGELQISGLYSLEGDWPRPWPGGESPGVYFLFSDRDHLAYIGVASAGEALADRLDALVSHGPHLQAAPIDARANAIQFVATIAVPALQAFEAPALAEFLVGELQPPRNKADGPS